MATNFSAAAYRTALQTLLDRHEVEVTVAAFTPDRDYSKFGGAAVADDGEERRAVAELVIESFPMSETGEQGTLDGVLTAGLLVMVKLTDDLADEDAFELALDVALALKDECDTDDESAPVMGAGPIFVKGIEPEAPEGALLHRVVAYQVNFEQAWRIRRASGPAAAPTTPTTLFVGRVAEGAEPADEYTQLVPPEE